MEVQLLVYKKCYRETFFFEDYTSPDDMIAIVRSGSFRMRCGNTEHTVSENEGAYFRKNVRYLRTVTSPVVLHLFRFRSDAPVLERDKITFQDTAGLLSTLSLLDKLDNRVFKNDFEYRQALFAALITQLAIETGESLYMDGLHDGVVQTAIAYMKERLHEKIMLSRIAQQYGLCYVQFSRRFKAATGMTPSIFLTNLRLQKARALLSEEKLSVRKIATECGFENEYYFSNVFKKHTGVSPTVFRNTMIRSPHQ